MIKLTATALIHSISPVIDIPSKNGGNPFQKRELVLDDSWEKDGQVHPNFVSIEFSGEAMIQLDNFYPGQRVTVEAYVNGREYNGRIFNSIRGRSVSAVQFQNYPQQSGYPQQFPQQTAFPQSIPQAAPMPGSAPAPQATPQQSYPQQSYPQHGYAPVPAAQPTQGYQQPQSPGVADLPWKS